MNERDEVTATVGDSHITTHHLRHTATALVNAGVSLQALMAILGHTSAEMSLRYAHLCCIVAWIKSRDARA